MKVQLSSWELKEPVGTRLTTPDGKGGQDVLEIIGVFQDVYYKSFHEKIEPMIMGLNTDNNNAYTPCADKRE